MATRIRREYLGTRYARPAGHERIQNRTGETIVTSPNPNDQLETTRVPSDQLKTYFDKFTRHFLLRESTNAVDVELLSPDLGDQFAAEGAREVARVHRLGITPASSANAEQSRRGK